MNNFQKEKKTKKILLKHKEKKFKLIPNERIAN